MNNVMVDIETLSTKRNAVIFSIAAAFFDPITGDVGPKFYELIDWQSDCNSHGAHIEPDTIKFWLAQSTEARMELLDQDGLGEFTDIVLQNFNDFIEKHHLKGCQLYAWSKSPSFDFVILREAFERYDLGGLPWNFWNERDVRTIEATGKINAITLPYTKVDVKHHAMSDVLGQISNVCTVNRSISLALEEISE
ncbi:hypothetical protein PU01_20495 [Hafnia alvei]|nr:hypothetical protein PU01_20495 [Hafnia alvei]MBW3474337.1 3'-5' exoribonuclease [Hafnia alvei]